MLHVNSKEDKFHKMFSEAANIVKYGAEILRETLGDCKNYKEESVLKMEELEQKVDKLVFKVAQELHQAFITPMDREDIYSVIEGMEYIIDSMNSAMHRFVMFNVDEATEASKKISDMLVEATNEIVILMSELKNMKKNNKIKDSIIKINEIERETDTLFREVVGELFRNEKNAIEIIKWKEIYQILENTIDNCESLANRVEGVIVKNA